MYVKNNYISHRIKLTKQKYLCLHELPTLMTHNFNNVTFLNQCNIFELVF